MYSVSYDKSFGVLVEKETGSSTDNAIVLTEDDTRNVGYNYNIHSNYQMYFEFTPSTDGFYVFMVSNANTCSLYLYDSTSESYITSSTYSTSLEYSLKGGETYYLRVYFTSSYDTSYSIITYKKSYGTSTADAIKVPLSSYVSTGYNTSYNSRYEMWFQFNSSDADQYALYLSSVSSSCYYDICVYDDADATNEVIRYYNGYGSSTYTFNCEADTTYYVRIAFQNTYDTSFSVQIYQN